MKYPSIIHAEPKVTILMGVLNGARHLPEQLDSIARQTHQNWHLVCSDDGSVDISVQILEEFAKAHLGQVTITNGPKSGFSDNYMSMIRDFATDSEYLCFADQDDIWLPEKITRSIQSLQVFAEQPVLYCGRHWHWYPATDRQIASPRLNRPFTLRNALIENIASGNTIMLNSAATKLASKAAQKTEHVFAHDWWLYLVITATGGLVDFDNGLPSIFYRQHADNAIGAGQGMGAQVQRKIGVLKGLFSQRIESNLNALRKIEDTLTPEARHICRSFSNARRKKGFSRVSALRSLGPYRQGRAATFGFWGAAALGRI